MQGLAHEIRQSIKNLNPRTWDWKNIRRQSGPLAVSTGAGLGALVACKQVYQPRPDRLHREACQCTPLEISTIELCLKSLRNAGADLQGLRQAASQFMGPLERDLFLVEYGLGQSSGGSQIFERLQQLLGLGLQQGDVKDMRERLYSALLKHWTARGYLEPPPPKITKYYDPNLAEDNYGHDIGCELPHCLLRERGDVLMNSLSGTSWESAASTLEQDGVVLLQSFLPSQRIAELRSKLGVHMSALDVRKDLGEFPAVRELNVKALHEVEPTLEEPNFSGVGRKHFLLRGNAVEGLVSDVQAGLLPLVWEHLSKIAAQRGLSQEQRPYLSEVQLLVTDPCAVGQLWHADNVSPGVTVYVPLTSVPAEIGATHFIYGTHHLLRQELPLRRRLLSFFSSFLTVEGLQTATMQAGDALVYDSRVFHKTTENRLYNRTRVDLVFRYDFERPPGVGMLGTQGINLTGFLCQFLQSMYRRIPCSSPAPN
mmetsp:Transcript_34386/g.78366  ORF Transcript_34386/g.78366 Transcript_34386/m.78366 type:complete len:483 (-) Transcript_34386:115-1563(-)